MADDRHIDSALRDVPLPADLAERVLAGALFDDARIDRLLVQVALPVGLEERMRSAGPADGRRADTTPAAGPPPAAGRLRSRWAVAGPATGLVAALACLAAVVLTGHDGPRWNGPSTWPQPIVLGPAVDSADLAARTGGDAGIVVGMSPDDQSTSFEPPEDRLVAFDPPPAAPSDEDDVPEIDPLRTEPSQPEVRGASLGGIGGMEPGMRVVPAPRAAARRAVPRAPNFDLAFEMAHGESPFVAPATLTTDRPPLTMGTDSFDALRGRAGRRPPAEVVAGLRTEEVLAALPAPARDAASGPAVAIHAVRSLRGLPETCLVEVAVTAGPLRRPAAAVDALLVLDPFFGSEPLLWPRICRALTAVANLMRADDRLSVVVGGPRPRLAGDRLDAAGLRRLAATLAAEPVVAAADFDATMRAAIRERERLGGRPLIVVAHVGSAERARDEGRSALAAWRESLAASGSGPAPVAAATRFVIVDPAEHAPLGPSGTASGPVAGDGRQLARELVERVFGVAGLTARQCRLEVSFDPKTVAGYRLVGHRQSAMESLASDPPPAIDLHAGETARIVYEVIPKAADGRAVTAKLSFRPLDSGGERAVAATLSLKAVESGPLPSPRGCELLLAVALGDVASGSPHAGPRGAAIQAVADLAAAWRSRGDVSPGGALLLETCDRLGFTPAVKPGTAPRPSTGGDRGRARLTD